MNRKTPPAQIAFEFEPAAMALVQIELPAIAVANHDYWQDFKAIAEKLYKQGFRSLCPFWWRSRYSEYIDKNNSAIKNDADWEFRRGGWAAWESIWVQHGHELCKY